MVLLGGLGLLSLSQLFCRVRLELSLDLEVLLGFLGSLVGMALLVPVGIAIPPNVLAQRLAMLQARGCAQSLALRVACELQTCAGVSRPN